MNPKIIYHWFHYRAKNYNLFMLEENDYDDDNNESKDPAIVLKHQKYTTWLYILLLIVSLYILFYSTLMRSHSKIITVNHITPKIFNQLYLDHVDTLSCPCSTSTIPHKTFVSNTIVFHPVCSSIFVSEQWIKALYLINASQYGPSDFRTTAKSQFQLLADLCSISRDVVSQNQMDFDNDEFITVHLLPEKQIQSELNAIINAIKNSISTQIISFLNYIRVYVRANYIVSGLNTNLMFSTYSSSNQYVIYQLQTQYTTDTTVFSSTPESMKCGTQNPTSPAGFFLRPSTTEVFKYAGWSKPPANSTLVNGFFGGCTSLEALLPSTLDCLYDIQCIQLLFYYFSALNELDFNSTTSVLFSKQQNITVYNYLLNLFIEEWATQVNYSQYFHQCAPLSCSYTKTDPTNFSYAATIFFSLYGGLAIIFRLIAPFLVRIFLKLKHCSSYETICIVFQSINTSKFVKSIQQLNLFKHINKRSEDNIKQQRITTRVYLILLTGSFMILLTFTSLSAEIVTITVSDPSLVTYNNLQISHSNTLRCPCSTTTIPYENFLSLSPILHQVCSSDFVTERWLSIVQNIVDYTAEDWRNRAYSQFKLLSNLCQLANNTIDDAVHRFLLQSLIVSNVLSGSEFNTQLNTTLNQFFQSTINSFRSLINITYLLTQVDQPYMGARKTDWDTIPDKDLTTTIKRDSITYERTLQVVFNLPGTRNVNLSGINCICATNSYCQSPVAIYQMDNIWNSRIYAYIDYIVPGSIAGCSTFNSLMFSQLLCFYSDADCFPILMKYMKESYYQNVEYPLWFDVRPLVNDSKSSRYPPNTSISNIVEEIMVEKWNPSYSYNRFYDLCAPNYCTYSEKIHTKSIFEVITTFVSMIGGLTVALHLITPQLVKFICYLLTIIFNRRSQQQQQSVRLSLWKRFCTAIKNFSSFSYHTVINLNIFSMRYFGSNVDRTRAKYLGKWATRVHIVLFMIGLTILTLYTVIQPETMTKTFDKPSFIIYKQLKLKYEDKLKCSCSVIASKYNQYVQIEAIFHQICTSVFTSNQWRINVTGGLISNLSTYGQRDYRRFLPAHLQYLQGLCQLSIQSINNSIEQFLTSLFITTELLSENDLLARINLLIEQRRSSASKTFTRLFFLIRSINHGNAIVSTYGTNFEYISPWFWTNTYYPYIPNKAMIYDNQCSCGLYSNCTTQAKFIEENSYDTIDIKGVKMGCTPSESLRSSTLECFYDQLCINLIEQYTRSTNQKNSSVPLSINMSRFLMNTTVAELIDDLFVEQWVTTINYSSYFEQCLPLLCSYTYDKQFNVLYIITALLGLQGGLTIVLKWISPGLVRIIAKLAEKRKKRSNFVEPTSFDSSSVATVETVVHNSVSGVQISPTNISSETSLESSRRYYLKVISMCLMSFIVITVIILFSIYVARLEKNDFIITTRLSTTTVSAVTNTIMKSTTTETTTSTTHLPVYQLKFEVTTRYSSGSTAGLKSPVVGDFNNDNLLDVAFFNYNTDSIHVLIGDGKGNYTTQLKTLVRSFSVWYFDMVVADFNSDKHLDIAFTSESSSYVYMVFGNGNGTFRSLVTFYMGSSTSLRGIVAFDFNGDNHTDIAVSITSLNSIVVLLGNGKGSFPNKTTYYTGRNTNPSSVDLADFNSDGYQDISYNNIMTRTIGVLLGRGDGTFEEQKTSFAGGYYYPSYIAIGDFNNDNRPDVAVSYSDGNMIGVLLGYGNGTMSSVDKFAVGNRTYYARIAVGDFNNDGHSDIVVNSIYSSVVYILVGYGDSNFEVQPIFSTGLHGNYTWVDVADFNKDGCQDILTSDDANGAVFILLNTCQCQTTPIIGTNACANP